MIQIQNLVIYQIFVKTITNPDTVMNENDRHLCEMLINSAMPINYITVKKTFDGWFTF